MKLTVIKKTDDRISFEVEGEGHTFLNLLRENAWKKGAKQAGYIIKHPYLSNPVFTTIGKNPVKILEDSATLIGEAAKDFEVQFSRSVKR